MNIITPPTYRERFVAALIALLGKPVLWRSKGPVAYDCSGSVTASLKLIGGRDLTLVDNAQALHEHSRLLQPALGSTEKPLPGDLVFCGTGPTDIEHVATIDETGTGVISADGATSHIDPLVLGFAKALALSMANPSNRVRRHPFEGFRKDLPFQVVHRNVFVDDLDGVSR